jgi:hypothetical protein
MAALTMDWNPMSIELPVQSRSRRRVEQSYNQNDFGQPIKVFPLGTKIASEDAILNNALPLLNEQSSEIDAPDILSQVLARLNSEMIIRDEDDEVRASEYAYKAARAVIESTYGRLQAEKRMPLKSLPNPIVATDDRGGLRISWENGEKHVRTSFAASEGLRSYLYFESPANHDVEELLPNTLSDRLDWILKP